MYSYSKVHIKKGKKWQNLTEKQSTKFLYY